MLSSFARPGLWPSESLGLLLHLKSLVFLPKGGVEADGINCVQGTCWALGTAMSPHPLLSSAVPTL